jgi:K+-sensing histidine kinase KdpD
MFRQSKKNPPILPANSVEKISSSMDRKENQESREQVFPLLFLSSLLLVPIIHSNIFTVYSQFIVQIIYSVAAVMPVYSAQLTGSRKIVGPRRNNLKSWR